MDLESENANDDDTYPARVPESQLLAKAFDLCHNDGPETVTATAEFVAAAAEVGRPSSSKGDRDRGL